MQPNGFGIWLHILQPSDFGNQLHDVLLFNMFVELNGVHKKIRDIEHYIELYYRGECLMATN